MTAENEFNKGWSSRVLSAALQAVITEYGSHYLPVWTRLWQLHLSVNPKDHMLQTAGSTQCSSTVLAGSLSPSNHRQHLQNKLYRSQSMDWTQPGLDHRWLLLANAVISSPLFTDLSHQHQHGLPAPWCLLPPSKGYHFLCKQIQQRILKPSSSGWRTEPYTSSQRFHPSVLNQYLSNPVFPMHIHITAHCWGQLLLLQLTCRAVKRLTVKLTVWPKLHSDEHP